MIDSTRGQTHILGFALAFALVIVVLTMWQSQVVPHQNEKIEFEHSTEMEGQMSELRDEMRRVSRFGTTASYTMSLSPQYPPRAMTMNPPEPSGRITVKEEMEVTYKRFSIVEHGYDPYNNQNFEVSHVRYTPNYHYYQNAVVYGIEHGVVYAEYPNGDTRVINGRNLVDGKTINIINIRGDYEETSPHVALEMKAEAHTTEYMNVEADNNANIELGTRMTEESWAEILGDEEYVKSWEHHGGSVEINLEGDEVYQVHNTMVRFDDEEGDDIDDQFLKKANGDGVTTIGGTHYQLEVVAHDELGNPIQGEKVEIDLLGGNDDDIEGTVYTDSDGKVSVTYSQDLISDILGGIISDPKIRFSIQDNQANHHRVVFELDKIDG